MNRNVMHLRNNSATQELGKKFYPRQSCLRSQLQNINMVGGFGIRKIFTKDNSWKFCESTVIKGRDLCAAFNPAFHAVELAQAERGLKVRDAVIKSKLLHFIVPRRDLLGMVLIPKSHIGVLEFLRVFGDPVRAQQDQHFIKRFVISCDGPTFTRSHRLDRMETEHACFRMGTASDSIPFRIDFISPSQCMASIFDHNQVSLFSNPGNFFKINRIAPKMDRKNDLCLACDTAFNLCSINVKCVGINVNKYWSGTREQNRIGRGNKTKRCSNSFVASAKAGGTACEVERCGSTGNGNRKLCSAEASKRGFKFRNGWTLG